MASDHHLGHNEGQLALTELLFGRIINQYLSLLKVSLSAPKDIISLLKKMYYLFLVIGDLASKDKADR